MGFEPTRAVTRLTVFEAVPLSRTWVILQWLSILYHQLGKIAKLFQIRRY